MQQVHQLPVFQPVEAVLALLAVFHQTRLLQLREMRGDAALAHGENLLQFRHGQFFAFEQQQEPQPAGIGQHSQRFQD